MPFKLKDTTKLSYAQHLRTSGETEDGSHSVLSRSGNFGIRELSLIEEKELVRSSREIQIQTVSGYSSQHAVGGIQGDKVVNTDRISNHSGQLLHWKPSVSQPKKPGCRTPCWCRALLLLLALLSMIALIVIYMTFQNGQENKPIEKGLVCQSVSVALRENLTIMCQLTGIDDTPSRIDILPPYLSRRGSIYVDTQNSTMAGWSGSISKNTVTLEVGPAGCHAMGVYEIDVYGNRNSTPIYSAYTNVNVASEVSDVQLELALDKNRTGGLNVSCSVNSGCYPTILQFLDNENEQLRGLNFTCTIAYNDYLGFEIRCQGTVPQFLLERINNTLGCQHAAERKEPVKRTLQDCDISNNCNYECTRQEGEYFTVDEARCDIFHRCVDGRAYTTYCSPGTFFSNDKCACAHRSDEERLEKCTSEGINNVAPTAVNASDCG